MAGIEMIYPELIINTKNWQHLYHAWKSERLPHALLFHGPQGTGKEGHALELTAMLNCTGENAPPCGYCPSCKKTKSFQNGSVKLILPLQRGKISSSNDPSMKAFRNEKALDDYLKMLKEKSQDPYYKIQVNGANTILINSIREIKQDVSMSTVNNEWKVILIFQAEKLCVPSPAAAHALLKVLEEPPEKTVFILVSSQPNIILETIHSRCQSLYFPPISNAVIQNQLVQSGIDQVQAAVIARISSGNVGLSRQLKDDYSDSMEKLYTFLNACFSKDPSVWEKCIDISVRLKNKNITKLEQLFRFTALFFRDLLYYKITGVDDEIIFKNQMGKIDKLSKAYPEGDWQACIQHIENTQNYILRNGYLPLMITNLMIDIQKALQGKFHKPFQLSDWTPV